MRELRNEYSQLRPNLTVGTRLTFAEKHLQAAARRTNAVSVNSLQNTNNKCRATYTYVRPGER